MGDERNWGNMETKFTYCFRRRSGRARSLDFHTENSFLAPDGILGKRIPKGCPNIYVREKRRCKQRSDSSDWKVVAASLLSQWRSRRIQSTIAVLQVGLMGSKAERRSIEVMYHRRFSKERPVDLLTKIFSSFSDDISKKRVLKESPNPCIRQRRKYMQGSSSRDQKDISVSSNSCKRSKRVCNGTSVLRQPLHDNLFDHCFQNIWRESPGARRSQFTYMNCFWFNMYTEEHYREKVLSWIKKQNIFSKRYVLVPILLRSHWSLLIFCHLGESLESKATSPCMLLLDSLHTYRAPQNLEPIIRRFVLDIFEIEDRPEDEDMVQKISLLVPKVPQQRNDKECGIFVLYFIDLFLQSAPEKFSISSGYPYFLKEDWFTEKELEGFYDKLETLGLESSDSEEDDESDNGEELLYRCDPDGIRKS